MKPTPLQARLLRFLAKWPATQVSYSPNSFNAPSKLLTFRSELPYHEWHAQHEVWAQEKNAEGIDRVRVATLQAMERGELLQRVDGRSWEVDLIPTEWARQVVQLMGPEEFVDPPARPRTEVIETRMMLDALRQRYQSDAGWTWFEEWNPGVHGYRRLDAFAFNRWRRRHPYERLAFEIKRSRGDFLNEPRAATAPVHTEVEDRAYAALVPIEPRRQTGAALAGDQHR